MQYYNNTALVFSAVAVGPPVLQQTVTSTIL